MDDRICLSKNENRPRTRIGSRQTHCNSFRRGHLRAYRRSLPRSDGKLEDRWSAASEGVLAALRLSKSAQSADKVHFSDSAELPSGSSRNLRAVSIGSGHNRSILRITNQISALFITVRQKARPKIVFIGPEIAEREPTEVITLPASEALPMVRSFARDHGRAFVSPDGTGPALPSSGGASSVPPHEQIYPHRTLVGLLAATFVTHAEDQKAKVDCTMKFSMSGWSVFYKRAERHGSCHLQQRSDREREARSARRRPHRRQIEHRERHRRFLEREEHRRDLRQLRQLPKRMRAR